MQISCFFFLFIFNEQEFTNRQKSFLTFWRGSTLRTKWKQKQARKFISLNHRGKVFPHPLTLVDFSSFVHINFRIISRYEMTLLLLERWKIWRKKSKLMFTFAWFQRPRSHIKRSSSLSFVFVLMFDRIKMIVTDFDDWLLSSSCGEKNCRNP